MINKEKRREYERKYRERNKDSYNLRKRKWRINHRNYYVNYQRNWRKKYPKKVKDIRRRSYYKNRKKQIEEAKTWNKENSERYNKNWRSWAMRNPIKINLRWHKRDAVKKMLKINFSAEQWHKKKFRANGICSICKKYVGYSGLTMDHIIPISKVPRGFVYNIKDVRPICQRCNAKKGNKLNWRGQR